MKPIQSPRHAGILSRPARVLATSIILLLASATFAKKGGGGGGGGDGGTINPVPAEIAPPVSYTVTELRWHEDTDPNFGGIWTAWVNQLGIAAGWVRRPHPTNPEQLGVRTGVINIDITTGAATDTLVELDLVFSTALAVLNATRSDGPWRIAYGRGGITDDGLIGCQLIPANEPRLVEDTIPCLLAVGDLSKRGADDALTLLTLESGDLDFTQLNQNGDALVATNNGSTIDTLFLRDTDVSGWVSYIPVAIPSVDYYYGRPTINSAGTVTFSETTNQPNESSLYQYPAVSGSQSLLWRSGNPSFYSVATAEDHSAYVVATKSITTGKGRHATTSAYLIPYHVISETERTPLTDYESEGSAVIRGHWNVSGAPLSGEEEIVLESVESGVYQIYKPNLGARFELPIAPGIARWVGVSPPYNDHLVSTPESYNGGYVVFTTNDAAPQGFILTPSQ